VSRAPDIAREDWNDGGPFGSASMSGLPSIASATAGSSAVLFFSVYSVCSVGYLHPFRPPRSLKLTAFRFATSLSHIAYRLPLLPLSVLGSDEMPTPCGFALLAHPVTL